MADHRDAWIVIEAAAREIDAQLKGQGSLNSIHVCDSEARIHINGTIDLAALALVIEDALLQFYQGQGNAK